MLLENTLTEHDLIYSVQPSCDVAAVITPIMQKRKLRLPKAVTWPTLRSQKGQNWDSNLNPKLGSEPLMELLS